MYGMSLGSLQRLPIIHCKHGSLNTLSSISYFSKQLCLISPGEGRPNRGVGLDSGSAKKKTENVMCVYVVCSL